MKKYLSDKGLSGASSLATCSVLKFFAEWSAYTAVYGMIKLHVTDDKFLYLILLYNLLCVCSTLVFGVVSDRITKHKNGVILGVALLGIGFALPINLGVTFKLVFCALGIGAINAFVGGYVIRQNGPHGIALIFGSSVLGFAVGRFNMFYGYIAIFVAVLCAALTPSPDFAILSDKADRNNRFLFPVLPFLLAILGTVFASFSFESYGFFRSVYTRRDFLIASVFFFASCIAYFVIRSFLKNNSFPFDVVFFPVFASLTVFSLMILNNEGLFRIAAVMISLGITVSATASVTCGSGRHAPLRFASFIAAGYTGHLISGFLSFEKSVNFSAPATISAFVLITIAAVFSYTSGSKTHESKA